MALKVQTNELGVSSGFRPVDGGKGPQRYETDPLEYNPDLQFPLSIPVYDAMRSQESHIGSVLQAVTLPIISARWRLVGDDVRPEVMELCRTELGLPLPGQSRVRRRREGIVWKNHVAEVAETLCWAGFIPFEQVYIVSPPRPDQKDIGLSEVVHLRKLAPRLPRSIIGIQVARDGGLVGVEQTNPDPKKSDEPLLIPVERLVMYVHRKEGSDWSGRSMLRTAYKNWLIKDVLLRLDAQAAERNSMGVPKFTIADENQRASADEQGRNFRSGAESRLILPPEVGFELVGVTGSLIDLTPRIEYQDREMSRAALAMFLDLGHEGGLGNGGALGDTFYTDVFLPSLQPLADYIGETATEHIIRDLVELNYGPDEPYPMLIPGDLKTNRDVSTEVIGALVSAKIITPDDALEDHFRERNGLPPVDKETSRTPAPVIAPAPFPGAILPEVVDPAAPADAPAFKSKPIDEMRNLVARFQHMADNGGHV